MTRTVYLPHLQSSLLRIQELLENVADVLSYLKVLDLSFANFLALDRWLSDLIRGAKA